VGQENDLRRHAIRPGILGEAIEHVSEEVERT
jgi:hypothetical protein